MDLEILNSGNVCDSGPKIFNEIEPYKAAEDELGSQLTKVLCLKVEVKADAIEAVKLDPAVLEAKLTVDADKLKKDEATATQPDSLPLFQKPNVPVPPSVSSTSSSSSFNETFKRMVLMQRDALQSEMGSLSPDQLSLLMRYVETLRRQRKLLQSTLECAFCKRNGESTAWYSSHALKNWRGRVQCPVLRAFRCPRCGATGDRAHTIKYCPEIDRRQYSYSWSL